MLFNVADSGCRMGRDGTLLKCEKSKKALTIRLTRDPANND